MIYTTGNITRTHYATRQCALHHKTTQRCVIIMILKLFGFNVIILVRPKLLSTYQTEKKCTKHKNNLRVN